MITWNLEAAADQIKNGGRFGAKRVREAVFRNNSEVFLRWAVPTEDGREVSLGDKAVFLAGTQVFASEQKPVEVPKACAETATGVINEGSFCICVDEPSLSAA